MTDRLYYTDATLTTFTGTVVRANAQRTEVVLDRSAFYPTSGGQPHDMGTLHGIVVHNVTEDGETVVHHLTEPLPAGVETVRGVLDWDRRHDLMQQHSGQHLLSAVFEDGYGWPTVSVHLGRDGCSLDLATEQLDLAVLPEVEQRVNALVAEQRPFSVSFEDATTAIGLRKASDRSGTLRIVSIAGIDRNACGGTHVAHTGAIGPVFLRRVERTRGVTRVEFRCGARAIARARTDAELLQQTAAQLSASPDDVPGLVAELQAAARSAEKERLRLEEALVAHEARALYDATPPDANGRRLCLRTLLDAPVKSVQTLAQQFTRNEAAVFLAMSTSPAAILLAAHTDSGIPCGRLLREALQAVGGRGGGADHLAQGSAPSAEAAEAGREHLLRALSEGAPGR